MADWILTFDDGPLPADVVTAEGRSEESLLGPLQRILNTLRTYGPVPIPAVFFLRGPAWPWAAPPPDHLYAEGIRLILEAGHELGIHCYNHRPELWWGWPLYCHEIKEDLDRCVAFFEPMVGRPMKIFRPPYGQGGLPGIEWARDRGIKHRLWDVNTDDWLHHPDGGLFRRFEDDAYGHFDHMMSVLPLRLFFHTLSPEPNDVLLHVSDRTASFLSRIIDRICELSEQLGYQPRFVLPKAYLGTHDASSSDTAGERLLPSS